MKKNVVMLMGLLCLVLCVISCKQTTNYLAIKNVSLFDSKGKMVLFDRNPFDDYKNLSAQKTIIKGGKLFALKKSLAYALQNVMVDKGADAGVAWFQKTKSDGDYGPLNSDELQNVTSELVGTGKIDEARAAFDLYSETFPNANMKIDGSILTNGVYALLRDKKEQKAMDFYAFGQANFPDVEKSLPQAVLITTLKNGIAVAKKRFSTLKNSTEFIFKEDEMNGVGYLLLQLDKPKEAIAFFKLNATSFPDSWNVYDSLAEGYAMDGQKALAIKYYRKSLELNPQNTYGKEQLKKLGYTSK